ncbi:MAG: hypothetical protein OXF24_00490 [Hyphomicrobiales bacterium]|nr:hypothetical protein [Hyphomicrobiales bacterium]MCY4054031.1 hypothetical protein [Hyphomicrobiales bacterium]
MKMFPDGLDNIVNFLVGNTGTQQGIRDAFAVFDPDGAAVWGRWFILR